METAVPLELFPSTTLRAALFENVTNGADLKAKLLSKALPCEAALVDAEYVYSQTILRAAATNAARRAANVSAKRPHVCRPNDAAKTRTLSTDLVYSLAPTSSVGDSLSTLGVSEQTTRLLVMAFQDDAQHFDDLLQLVDGDRRPLAGLDARDNAARDARVAELFGLPAEALNVERAILTKLATKDIK